MCNKTVSKMIVMRGCINSVINGLSRLRPLSLRMIQNKTYIAPYKLENKCLFYLPFKTVPLLINRHIECNGLASIRYHFYCTQNKTPCLPKLMEFPEIAWPSIIKSVRNWILAHFIIMRYFDKDFNLPDFVNGSKKAVEVVSGYLSRGDINGLQELVTPDATTEIKKNLSQFNMAQRQQLAVVEDDIYFSFPYEIGVIFPDEDDKGEQERFVEITMCYHVLQGLKEMREQGDSIPINIGVMPEYREKIFICNYRFIREFSKGVNGEWTINALNHYKPADQLINN